MKRSLLLVSTVVAALAAQAQYSVSPATADVIAKGVKSVDYILLSEGAINDFAKAGAKVTYVGPSPDEGRNLWIWDNTFNGGDSSMPRVDEEEGEYVAVEVGIIGWSGAGFAVADPGISTMDFTNETRFHVAYMTPTNNAPASVAIILMDGDLAGSAPAKFAIGDPFNDNGQVFPAVAPKMTDEWQGLDISLGDLRKLWPTFNFVNSNAWLGNLMAWLGGGVTGQSMAFDAMYFYNVGEAAVESAAADNIAFVVTDKTLNVMGAEGIEIYALDGKLVKETAGTTLGLDGLLQGVYVARSGAATQKIMVK